MASRAVMQRPVAGYLLFRLLLGMGAMGLALATLREQPQMVLSLGFQFAIAALFFGAMGVSAAMVPRYGRTAWFPWSQLAIDTLFATALVSVTNGPLSPFFPLFFINVVASAWLLPPSGPLIVALIDTIAFGGLLAAKSVGLLVWEIESTGMTLYSEVLLRVFAFLLVGVLSGYLSLQWEKAHHAFMEQRQETRVLRAKHNLVLDELKAGVLFSAANGVVLDANPAAIQLMGEVVGRDLDSLFPNEEGSWEQLFRVVQFEEPDSGKVSRGASNASDDEGEAPGNRILLCSRTPLEDGGEVVLLEDVTLLRNMEEEVERQERLSALGRLAANLAHEIRNPLASLSGSVQLLKDDNPGPLHDIVLREVNRLNDLVAELLDGSRPVSLELREHEPDKIIGEVVTTFRNDGRFQGRHTIRTRATGVGSTVMDGGRFRQVLWNLLLNAAQATPEYGEIEVSAFSVDDGLEVRVKDKGIGIDPEGLRRIFDPFFTTNKAGTGLGLANVERIMIAHGGSISVESRVGEGTCFTLRFPFNVEQILQSRELEEKPLQKLADAE